MELYLFLNIKTVKKATIETTKHSISIRKGYIPKFPPGKFVIFRVKTLNKKFITDIKTITSALFNKIFFMPEN